MATFRNISPLGALEVPALGRVIDEGEEFDVNDEFLPLLAGQTENFEAIDAAAKLAAEAASTGFEPDTASDPDIEAAPEPDTASAARSSKKEAAK